MERRYSNLGNENYESQETHVVVELLAAYSARLSSSAEQQGRIQHRIVFPIYAMLSFIPLFIIMMLKFSTWEGFVGGLLLYPPLIFSLIKNIKRKKSIDEDVKILTIKLEKIVEKASSMIKYVDQDTVQRLDLEYRLEDAERALRNTGR